MEKSKVTIIAVIVVLIVLGFFGYQTIGQKERGLETINPFNPETDNLLEGTSNPYEDIKTNPFE